jgi:hypothetical protein
MSATGWYVVLTKRDLERCLDLARRVQRESTGRWFWKKTIETGRDEFDRAWNAAVTKKIEFEHSGFALADYFTAQQEVNGYREDPFDSPDGLALARVFTSAYPVTTPTTFPPLVAASLKAFCAEEYGEDDVSGLQAIQAAHEFYAEGISQVSAEAAVVFAIE